MTFGKGEINPFTENPDILKNLRQLVTDYSLTAQDLGGLVEVLQNTKQEFELWVGRHQNIAEMIKRFGEMGLQAVRKHVNFQKINRERSTNYSALLMVTKK